MASSGWVEERGKGRWRLSVNCGANEDGSRKIIRETVKAKNRDAALKKLGLFIKKIEQGEYIEPTKQTFKVFVEKWLKTHAEKSLAPKTLYRYHQLLDSRIIPALGQIKLDKIKPIHLIDFYSNLTEDGIREDGRSGGLSERTILHHHRLISSILQDAVEWQIIPSNPASKVPPPKVHMKHSKFYDEEEIKALMSAVETEATKHKALIYLAVFCGLRCGEIMGLEWKDIDFEKNLLMVRQAGQYIPGQGAFTKEPKNESSRRMISMPLRVLNVLSQHKAEQDEVAEKLEDLWHESERVFTTRDGKAAHPEWPSQWFPKFLRRKNLPPLPFHGLRHTAATIMISQGADVKNLSSRLGHANTSTTLNIYSHALKSIDRDIAEKTDAYIEKMFSREGQADLQEQSVMDEQKPALTLVK